MHGKNSAGQAVDNPEHQQIRVETEEIGATNAV